MRQVDDEAPVVGAALAGDVGDGGRAGRDGIRERGGVDGAPPRSPMTRPIWHGAACRRWPWRERGQALIDELFAAPRRSWRLY